MSSNRISDRQPPSPDSLPPARGNDAPKISGQAGIGARRGRSSSLLNIIDGIRAEISDESSLGLTAVISKTLSGLSKSDATSEVAPQGRQAIEEDAGALPLEAEEKKKMVTDALDKMCKGVVDISPEDARFTFLYLLRVVGDYEGAKLGEILHEAGIPDAASVVGFKAVTAQKMQKGRDALLRHIDMEAAALTNVLDEVKRGVAR